MGKINAREVKYPFNWMPGIEIQELGPCKYPTPSDGLSIGYDLFVPHDIVVPAHSRIVVPLNFAIKLPFCVEAKIEARSGFSLKGMEGVGVKKRVKKFLGIIPVTITEYGVFRFDADVISGKVDPGYRGNVGVIISNHDEMFTLRAGTKIAQMTFYRVLRPRKFLKREELGGIDRGGGFGHSGTR